MQGQAECFYDELTKFHFFFAVPSILGAGKRRSFGPRASRAPQGSDQSSHVWSLFPPFFARSDVSDVRSDFGVRSQKEEMSDLKKSGGIGGKEAGENEKRGEKRLARVPTDPVARGKRRGFSPGASRAPIRSNSSQTPVARGWLRG